MSRRQTMLAWVTVVLVFVFLMFAVTAWANHANHETDVKREMCKSLPPSDRYSCFP